jgi:hypothetical protein
LPACRKNVVAEVGKRGSGPKYARQTRSQKGRSGSSERGPSSEWASADETVGECIERKNIERSGAPDKNGSESTETHGDVRASSSGLRGRAERSHGGRGTGVVMATGSYEGSLPREGILVCWKRRSSRTGVEGRLGGFSITTIRTHAQQDDGRTGTHEGDVQVGMNGKTRQGMSEARLLLAPWEENAHARVRKAVRQNARGKHWNANSVGVV